MRRKVSKHGENGTNWETVVKIHVEKCDTNWETVVKIQVGKCDTNFVKWPRVINSLRVL